MHHCTEKVAKPPDSFYIPSAVTSKSTSPRGSTAELKILGSELGFLEVREPRGDQSVRKELPIEAHIKVKNSVGCDTCLTCGPMIDVFVSGLRQATAGSGGTQDQWDLLITRPFHTSAMEITKNMRQSDNNLTPSHITSLGVLPPLLSFPWHIRTHGPSVPTPADCVLTVSPRQSFKVVSSRRTFHLNPFTRPRSPRTAVSLAGKHALRTSPWDRQPVTSPRGDTAQNNTPQLRFYRQIAPEKDYTRRLDDAKPSDSPLTFPGNRKITDNEVPQAHHSALLCLIIGEHLIPSLAFQLSMATTGPVSAHVEMSSSTPRTVTRDDLETRVRVDAYLAYTCPLVKVSQVTVGVAPYHSASQTEGGVGPSPVAGDLSLGAACGCLQVPH
ncbi:hypothetical protein Bbelb_225070 [Branchiostoma belcheri]|nr:hypothetical protein Bbelb_225070 [Branchiostoma belcheri]